MPPTPVPDTTKNAYTVLFQLHRYWFVGFYADLPEALQVAATLRQRYRIAVYVAWILE